MGLSPIDAATGVFDYPLVPPAGATTRSAQAGPVSAQVETQPASPAASDQASLAATARPAEFAAEPGSTGNRPKERRPGSSPEDSDPRSGDSGLIVRLSAEGKQAAAASQSFTSQEQAELNQLKQRDQEVRAHEQAHKSAGGRYVRGGARYDYQTGPDGRQYAVGGEVSIDTSEAATPQATMAKAQTIRRAALAPAQPSGADRQVAAKASQMEAEARAELAREKAEEAELAGEQKDPGAPAAPTGPAGPAGPHRPLSVYV